MDAVDFCILLGVLSGLLGSAVITLWKRARSLERQLAEFKDKVAMDERARVAARELVARSRERRVQEARGGINPRWDSIAARQEEAGRNPSPFWAIIPRELEHLRARAIGYRAEDYAQLEASPRFNPNTFEVERPEEGADFSDEWRAARPAFLRGSPSGSPRRMPEEAKSVPKSVYEWLKKPGV